MTKKDVRELHTPTLFDVLSEECGLGLCEHAALGECSTIEITVCSYCTDLEDVGGLVDEYPCATIEALDKKKSKK